MNGQTNCGGKANAKGFTTATKPTPDGALTTVSAAAT
jgi:hypothetical protein